MIRLILIALLLLISLLAIFHAPTYHLWMLAIGVTEFPWVFILPTLILLGLGYWFDEYQLAGTITGIVALVLFILPIMQSYRIAGKLNDQLTKAFGRNSIVTSDDHTDHPFRLLKMFNNDAVKVKYTSITYVQYADTSLTLDFYPSMMDGQRPCVLVVHGGSWSGGDSQQLPELNDYLATKGYNVASINYRLAPKYKNPDPVEDVKSALKYLKEHPELNVDTSRIVLLGRSAGAQIALLAAYTLHDKTIKGVIDFYGPADMVWGYSLPTSPLVMDSRAVMEHYLGGTYKQVPQNYVASSPIEFVDRQSPPTLILHGENDVLVAYEHSRRLNARLKENNITHYWLQLPWATHGFDYTLNGPGGQLSTYAVERFLKAVTYKPE